MAAGVLLRGLAAGNTEEEDEDEGAEMEELTDVSTGPASVHWSGVGPASTRRHLSTTITALLMDDGGTSGLYRAVKEPSELEQRQLV